MNDDNTRKAWIDQKMKRIVATVGILAIGVVVAQAQQYPYRERSPYRTAFVDAVSRTCMRVNVDIPANAGVPKETLTQVCECKAMMIANFVTDSDLEEAAKGGMHRTARMDELEQKAYVSCTNIITGKGPP